MNITFIFFSSSCFLAILSGASDKSETSRFCTARTWFRPGRAPTTNLQLQVFKAAVVLRSMQRKSAVSARDGHPLQLPFLNHNIWAVASPATTLQHSRSNIYSRWTPELLKRQSRRTFSPPPHPCTYFMYFLSFFHPLCYTPFDSSS